MWKSDEYNVPASEVESLKSSIGKVMDSEYGGSKGHTHASATNVSMGKMGSYQDSADKHTPGSKNKLLNENLKLSRLDNRMTIEHFDPAKDIDNVKLDERSMPRVTNLY